MTADLSMVLSIAHFMSQGKNKGADIDSSHPAALASRINQPTNQAFFQAFVQLAKFTADYSFAIPGLHASDPSGD